MCMLGIRYKNARFKSVFVDVPVQVVSRMISARHSKSSGCSVSQWVLVELKFKSFPWLKAALLPLSLISELPVSITEMDTENKDKSDLENLKWDSLSGWGSAFGRSCLKALISSTIIDLRTLAPVALMSDCFPSSMYFGKIFPVEEINKFQGDISFFI